MGFTLRNATIAVFFSRYVVNKLQALVLLSLFGEAAPAARKQHASVQVPYKHEQAEG